MAKIMPESPTASPVLRILAPHPPCNLGCTHQGLPGGINIIIHQAVHSKSSKDQLHELHRQISGNQPFNYVTNYPQVETWNLIRFLVRGS